MRDDLWDTLQKLLIIVNSHLIDMGERPIRREELLTAVLQQALEVHTVEIKNEHLALGATQIIEDLIKLNPDNAPLLPSPETTPLPNGGRATRGTKPDAWRIRPPRKRPVRRPAPVKP